MMVKWIGLSALLTLVAGCAPRPLAPAPPPAKAELLDYYSARAGWQQARRLVLPSAADAVLVRIEGRFVDAGGRSSSWSYEFASPALGRRLVVQDNRLQLVEPLSVPVLQAFDHGRWRFDSDAAVAVLRLGQQPAFPVTSLTLDADLIWRFGSPGGRWSLSAETGRLLTMNNEQ